MYQLVDFLTKQPVSSDNMVFTGVNSPWEIQMNFDKIKHELNIDYFKSLPSGLSKYLKLMPIRTFSHFVSLGEIATPLVKSKVLGPELNVDLYFKVEGKNPTGSFKDRGSAVDISVAKEMGAKAVILASTGNMAASCACYAAAAHLPCFILVPEGVPMGKLAQVIAFGGHIVQVQGGYNEAAQLAEKIAARMGFYLAGDYAFRVEGQKTAAFEVVEQLYFQPPDLVIVPIGCGTNLAAYAKGFNEYQNLGFISHVPALMGVQAEGAAAVVNSFNHHQTTITPLEATNTVASAIAVSNPIDGVKALEAIYRTKGTAISVNDQQIFQARYRLSAEEGLFVESASAATIAALLKTAAEGSLQAKKIVCVLTGDGLKDTDVLSQSFQEPMTIQPTEDAFFKFFTKLR